MIDIVELLRSGKVPNANLLKLSLGSKVFNEWSEIFTKLEEKNFRLLAKYLEKHPTENIAFGMQQVYPVLLAYALAANQGDKDAYTAMIRIANKVIHGYDYEDASLRNVIEFCEEQKESLKSKKVNIKDILAHSAVMQDLKHLFDSLNSFEDRILAERIDTAYQLYEHCRKYHEAKFENTLLPDEKQEINATEKAALEFLKMTLNVSTEKDIKALMAARARIKCYKPEYIPKKHARNLSKLPSVRSNSSKAQKNWLHLAELARAHKPTKYLEMRAEKYESDVENKTTFLNALERDAHRIIIKDGEFFQRQHDNRFERFDTANRRSHGKDDYVAYTINPEHELSVFDHHEIADGFAHSSMNAQGKIIVSGELKVTDGQLTHITVYSMHYRPQEENVYEALKIFKDEGVDLSKVTVRLWDERKNIRNNVFLDVNAQDFFDFHEKIEKENEKVKIILHDGYKEYEHPNGESFFEMIANEGETVNGKPNGFFSIANQAFKFPQRSIVDEKPELISRKVNKL